MRARSQGRFVRRRAARRGGVCVALVAVLVLAGVLGAVRIGRPVGSEIDAPVPRAAARHAANPVRATPRATPVARGDAPSTERARLTRPDPGAAASAPPTPGHDGVPEGHHRARAWTNRDVQGADLALDPRDLRALADLVAANGLDESASPHDYDDGDGSLAPTEVGFQRWRDGRLVALSTGADRYDSFGYSLRTLPPSLGDLDALEELDLHSNAIEGLPESVAGLRSLRVLRLHRNALSTLPDGIGRLPALEELTLGENALAELPPAVGDLASLRELHANDNPIATLPESLGRLSALRVLNVSHRAAAGSGPELGARLDRLPVSLEASGTLAVLHVAGNRLFCAGGDAARLPVRWRDGGTTRVFGLGAQECAIAPARP